MKLSSSSDQTKTDIIVNSFNKNNFNINDINKDYLYVESEIGKNGVDKIKNGIPANLKKHNHSILDD